MLSHIFPKKSISLFDHGKVTLKWISPFPIGDYGSDYSIVEAARTSFGQGLKGVQPDGKLVSFLWKNKHTTPFEHISITMRIKCPIAISKHFIRHRTFSFNEVSARYKPVDGEFYLPEKLRKQSTSNKQVSNDEEIKDEWDLLQEMSDHYENGKKLYDKLLKHEVAREQARFILAQGVYTCFYMTGNLRNWLHFLGLREAPYAQYEMQEYSHAIHTLIKPYIPLTEEAIKQV